MNKVSRFYDLRTPGLKWESSASYLDPNIITPSGEQLAAINLPGASICADFLVTKNPVAWAGVTVAIHEDDFQTIKSTLELATNSILKLISPNEGLKLPRYKDLPMRGWLEVKWLDADNVEIYPTQTNGALWYAIVCPKTQMPKIVVLALERIDYMLKEGPEGLVLPD